MDGKTIEWTERMREVFMNYVGRVLEIGSLDLNGSVKHLFSDAREYIGIDMRGGKNVDIVMNAHDVYSKFGMDSFDTVLCYNTLEHDDSFWVTLENIRKVLRVGGWLIISAPTYGFPIHDYPGDYWRFSEEVYEKVFFKGFEILALDEIFTKQIKNKGINPVFACLGVKRNVRNN